MARDYQIRGFTGGAPATSTLSGSIGTGDTTFSFNSGGGTGFPTANFPVVFDALNGSLEKMLVGARSGDNCTGVVRAQDNTTAKAHSSGASILHCGFAQDFTENNAVAAALTTKGDSLWKGGTLSVAPARLAAGADQQIVRYLAANALGVETTHKGSIPIFASTAARDAAIAAPSGGQADYEDTGDVLEGPWFYNGTSWRRPWNMPWGIMGTGQATANQTGITAATNITNVTTSFTAVTGRRYKTHVFLPFVTQNTSAATVLFIIADGANVQSQAATIKINASDFQPLAVMMVETIAAGAVTRKARISTSAGTIDINSSAGAPSLIVVEDIGPSGAPT